jgi:putative PIN family toxin of toxin-antitoxin system
MKIFTDTNVLVSAFTARGLCADLFEIILADHQLIIGEVVLVELERVLLLKLKVPEKDVFKTLQFLRKQQIQPLPNSASELNIRDEDDRWILESAIQAQADILVTGDKDLLSVAEQVKQFKIISPRQFWELLKE